MWAEQKRREIERECAEEARRDEQLLQRNIDEAVKEALSDEERSQERRK